MKVSPAKPHSRTGLPANRQDDRLWSGALVYQVSEPWACVGRTELHTSKAGGRHLIKQAFLSKRYLNFHDAVIC